MKDLDLQLYERIKLIRETEEAIRVLYPTDKIKSPVHLSVGHEAIAVGVCLALQKADTIFGYYRSHAIYLAKGGNLNAMMAELYGKRTGCAHGWGGSMHLVDTEYGVNSTTAIVASSIPNAVGAAYAAKLRGTNQVVVSFFGDGATEEGVVWESLNFAALHALPIIFVCENNGLAIHTHQKDRQANTSIVERVKAFGVRTLHSTGNDPLVVYNEVSHVVDSVRFGDGPFFFEFTTSRWLEHVGPGEDWNLGYRAQEHVKPWQGFADGVNIAAERIDEVTRQHIDDSIQNKIKDAVAFAEQSEFPEVKELLNYVYRQNYQLC